MAKPKKQKRSHRNSVEDKIIQVVDQLNAFEKFKAMIPPELQAELAAGTPAEKILKKYKNYAAIRIVADTVSPFSRTAVRSAREVLDRVDGRPTEKIENTNKYDNLPDSQLKALMETKMAEVEELRKAPAKKNIDS